jgi:uncharacterized RDD family membrane protein YckC
MTNENISTKTNLWKRMFAGLIDYFLMFGIFYVICLYFGKYNGHGYELEGFSGLSVILIWLLYIIGLELTFGGTFGNLIFNLKVISIHPKKTSLTFDQSFKRHLFDILEMWPFGLIGILLIKNTKYNQRLGDIWAKTIVIDIKDENQFYKRFA